MRRIALFTVSAVLLASPPAPKSLSIEPSNPLLFGQNATQALVVVARYSDGSEQDITKQSQFFSARPTVASVGPNGLITAHADGAATIRVTYQGLTAKTAALVQRGQAPIAQSFNADVLPVLTKMGCNGGSCHGALNGQNGFKLSLFGYEPDKDYDMIVHKHDGRRLNLTDPEKSLLL